MIRYQNIKSYDTYWADDGGGHITYIEKILYENRLATLDETYLAWHEPLYYYVLVGWIKVGGFFGIEGQNWWESFNVLLYFIFLVLIWKFSYFYSDKNKWIALLNTFIFSVIFVGVKLSAYINNELSLHTLIILLLYLFYKFKLVDKGKELKLIYWALILGLSVLVKVTALIILLAIILFYLLKYIVCRQKYLLKYIVIIFFVVFFVNLPWITYKQQNYNTYFTINIYDDKPKQSIIKSTGWKYIFTVNTHIFTDYPYWFSKPDSYFSVLLSDSFGDYYNLFNYPGIENFEEDQKILVGNGRYTTTKLWQSMLNTNRLALGFFVIWFLGFFAYLFSLLKKKKIKDNDLFLLIVLFGGWLASFYHNLRLPYLEVGVLKAHFIYFTYPILTLIAYKKWWQIFKNKLWWFILAFGPWILYLLIAKNILLTNIY
ncbi:glycosyltransferase family 39 protein [bacterium]|nr:glycosyltransferase family 39 protein [bacterium]